MDRMVGKNAVKLILPEEYSRLHPVFNVSLIMSYFTKGTNSQNERPAEGNFSDRDAVEYLTNWVAIEFIVDHRLKNSIHEYLIRASIRSGNEDDFWVPLQQISRALDPFIQRFHDLHWDHIRPGRSQFLSNLQPEKGLVVCKVSV